MALAPSLQANGPASWASWLVMVKCSMVRAECTWSVIVSATFGDEPKAEPVEQTTSVASGVFEVTAAQREQQNRQRHRSRTRPVKASK